MDIVAYSAQIAAQLGANIIKVKPPTAFIEQAEAKTAFQAQGANFEKMSERTRHVIESAFNGKRITIFSGGEAKTTEMLLEETKGLALGGSFGSIMGRNAFQRPKAEAIKLLHSVMDIYAGTGM